MEIDRTDRFPQRRSERRARAGRDFFGAAF